MKNLIDIFISYKTNCLIKYGLLIYNKDNKFIRDVFATYFKTYIDNYYYDIFHTVDVLEFNEEVLKKEFTGCMEELLDEYRNYELQVSNEEYSNNVKIIKELKDISYDFTVEYRGSLLGDLQSEVISITPNLRTENPDYSIEKGDLNSIDGYVDFITTSQEYGVVALVTVLSNSAFIKSDSLCYEFGDSGLVFDVNSVYANSDSNLGYGNKILFVLNKEESVVKEENGICVM